MSLVRLQLRHGQRKADADPAVEAVDGNDPPVSMPSAGIGEDRDGHVRPTLLRGSLPVQQSLREGSCSLSGRSNLALVSMLAYESRGHPQGWLSHALLAGYGAPKAESTI